MSSMNSGVVTIRLSLGLLPVFSEEETISAPVSDTAESVSYKSAS